MFSGQYPIFCSESEKKGDNTCSWVKLYIIAKQGRRRSCVFHITRTTMNPSFHPFSMNYGARIARLSPLACVFTFHPHVLAYRAPAGPVIDVARFHWCKQPISMNMVSAYKYCMQTRSWESNSKGWHRVYSTKEYYETNNKQVSGISGPSVSAFPWLSQQS